MDPGPLCRCGHPMGLHMVQVLECLDCTDCRGWRPGRTDQLELPTAAGGQQP